MTSVAEYICSKMEEYITIPSVVGYEGPFTTYLEKEYKAKGYTVERMNNFLAVHGNNPNSRIISVHIDRHGVIKTRRNEYQYAAFVVEKDWFNLDYYKSPDFLLGLYNEYVNEKVEAYDYITGKKLGQAYIEDTYMNTSLNQLSFTINGMDDLRIGTPLSYSLAYENDVINERFSGQIDNVVSVALVSYLFSIGFEGTCLFTPEEEIGQSRSYIHFYLKKHGLSLKNLIVLDTCPRDDMTYINDGYVILRNQDALGHFSLSDVFHVQKIADLCNIPWVKADEVIEEQNETAESMGTIKKSLGLTELGQLITHTNGKYMGFTIQIPTIGYHTNHETTSYVCIENRAKLVSSYLQLSGISEIYSHSYQQQQQQQ